MIAIVIIHVLPKKTPFRDNCIFYKCLKMQYIMTLRQASFVSPSFRKFSCPPCLHQQLWEFKSEVWP
jgi:hypothetical protein